MTKEIALRKSIEDSVLMLRGQAVLLDSDIAEFYGVETKRINEAIRNNPDKFPKGYVIETTKDELSALRSKISTLETNGRGEYTKYPPKAFTERGLYMLATILKSQQATAVTIQIIETFATIREAGRAMHEMAISVNQSIKKKWGEKASTLVGDILHNSLPVETVETEISFNFAVVKVKQTVTRGKRPTKKERKK